MFNGIVCVSLSVSSQFYFPVGAFILIIFDESHSVLMRLCICVFEQQSYILFFTSTVRVSKWFFLSYGAFMILFRSILNTILKCDCNLRKTWAPVENAQVFKILLWLCENVTKSAINANALGDKH